MCCGIILLFNKYVIWQRSAGLTSMQGFDCFFTWVRCEEHPNMSCTSHHLESLPNLARLDSPDPWILKTQLPRHVWSKPCFNQDARPLQSFDGKHYASETVRGVRCFEYYFVWVWSAEDQTGRSFLYIYAGVMTHYRPCRLVDTE